MKTLDQALAEVSYGYPKEFIDLIRFVMPEECEFPAHEDGDYDAVLTEHDSHDPGGTTRYGIDAASHPHVDIDKLSFAGAVDIYHSTIWLPLRCDEITSEQVQLSLCDAAINCGNVRAIRWLQAASQAAVDGNLGKDTLRAVNMMDGDELAGKLNDTRQDYYQNQVRPALRALYEKGWMNRLDALREYIKQLP